MHCLATAWSDLIEDPQTRAALIGASAALVTGFLAFVGVMRGLAVNRKEQREDRLLNLRRDAYLRAGEAYAAAVEALSLITNPQIEDVTPLMFPVVNRFAAAVANVYIVAGQRLMDATEQLHREYLKIYARLVAERYALVRRQFEINNNAARITQLANLAVQAPQHAREINQQIIELEKANNRLWVEQFEDQVRLLDKFVNEPAAKLAPLAIAATFEAKKEFGLNIDLNSFLARSREASDELRIAARESIASLRQQLPGMSDDAVG